jgi:ketosteroid isomerase-like protein
MSEQDVETVRRLMESFQGGPLEPALALAHPEIEFDARVRPDGKVWHGPEGVVQAMLEWTGTWSDWTMDVEDILEAGDGRIAVLWREWGRARDGGAEMSQEGVTVITLREGLVVSVVVEVDRRGTLAALGLAEEG